MSPHVITTPHYSDTPEFRHLQLKHPNIPTTLYNDTNEGSCIPLPRHPIVPIPRYTDTFPISFFSSKQFIITNVNYLINNCMELTCVKIFHIWGDVGSFICRNNMVVKSLGTDYLTDAGVVHDPHVY